MGGYEQHLPLLSRTAVLNIVDLKIDNLVFKCIIWVSKTPEVWFISYFYFFHQELHAHINGSVSESTIEKLVAKKQKLDHQFSFKKGSTATLKEWVHIDTLNQLVHLHQFS